MASDTEQYLIDGCMLHHCHLGMVHKTLNAIPVLLTMITIMVMMVMHVSACLLAIIIFVTIVPFFVLNFFLLTRIPRLVIVRFLLLLHTLMTCLLSLYFLVCVMS